MKKLCLAVSKYMHSKNRPTIAGARGIGSVYAYNNFNSNRSNKNYQGHTNTMTLNIENDGTGQDDHNNNGNNDNIYQDPTTVQPIPFANVSQSSFRIIHLTYYHKNHNECISITSQ